MEEKYGISLSNSKLTAGESRFFSYVEIWNIAIENLEYVAIF